MPALPALRRLHALHWLGFYGGVLLAWAGLYAMQLPADLLAAAEFYGAEFWAALCTVEPGLSGAPSVFVMWALMAGAMMAPTVVPALMTWEDLHHAGVGAGFAALVLGYLAVWLGFAALATGAQLGLVGLGLTDPYGGSQSRWLSAGLLGAAGAYQFSTWKAACLLKCRRPLTFFMQYWDEGPLRMGLRLGLVCLGCCWALMALGLIGGMMSLLWMGLAMVLMLVEKLPQLAGWLSRPLGVGLLAASAAVLVV